MSSALSYLTVLLPRSGEASATDGDVNYYVHLSEILGRCFRTAMM